MINNFQSNNENDDLYSSVKLQNDSAEWICNETDKMILEYRNCKTEFARKKLLPKIEAVFKKVNFEKRGIDILIQRAKDEGIEF